MKQTLTVIVRDRTGIIFNEEAKAVTSLNHKGTFDVLPEHANFISIIQDSVILHKANNTDHEIKLDRGILKVNENTVQIHVGVLPQFLTDEPMK